LRSVVAGFGFVGLVGGDHDVTAAGEVAFGLGGVAFVADEFFGESAEVEGIFAGFLADDAEEVGDGGDGAAAFTGDLGYRALLDAVEAKDGEHSRRFGARSGGEFLDQGEGFVAGEKIGGLVQGRRQLAEEGGGVGEGDEGAVLAEVHERVEAEAGGTDGLQESTGGSGEEGGGGRKDDKRLVKLADEGSQGVQEVAGARLDGEEDREVVENADLKGVVRRRASEFGFEAEGGSQGAGEFRPVQFERDDVIGQDGISIAAAASADGEHGAVRLGDDFVEDAAAGDGGDEFDGVLRDRFEEGGFEGLVVAVEVIAPDRPDGAQAGE
jgi:hypothetical protein